MQVGIANLVSCDAYMDVRTLTATLLVHELPNLILLLLHPAITGSTPRSFVIVLCCTLILDRYLDMTGLSQGQSQHLDKKIQPKMESAVVELKMESQTKASSPFIATNTPGQQGGEVAGLVSGFLLLNIFGG